MSIATTIVMLGGCSGGTFAPKPVLPQGDAYRQVSFYSCPAKGTIVYLADGDDNLVDIYAGNLAGQAPCGQLTTSMNEPNGLFVQASTHDLYVANRADQNILVFHRGQTTPYNIYVDRYHSPQDVSVAKDGTVIDIHGAGISTWIGGPNGGTFVNTFPLKHHPDGHWITIRTDGIIFYDDSNTTTKLGELWYLKCPAGQCRKQKQAAGISFVFPGGMAFDKAGDLLVVSSQGPNSTNNTLQTFDLPNPTPSAFPLLPGWPMAMAFTRSNLHVYVADEQNHNASEYSYPNGVLVGTVTCCTGANQLDRKALLSIRRARDEIVRLRRCKEAMSSGFRLLYLVSTVAIILAAISGCADHKTGVDFANKTELDQLVRVQLPHGTTKATIYRFMKKNGFIDQDGNKSVPSTLLAVREDKGPFCHIYTWIRFYINAKSRLSKYAINQHSVCL